MNGSSSKHGSNETAWKAFDWRLILGLIVLAGLISAVFNFSSYGSNGVAFGTLGMAIGVVLGSLSFGLALGAVLWFRGLIQNWTTLAVIVAVTVAAHVLESLGETFSPTSFLKDVDVPILGSIEPRLAMTSSGVALVLYLVLLLVTTPRCRIGWALPIALVSASLAGATIAAVDHSQQGAWISLWKAVRLGLLWQLALSFFLGLALAIKGVIAFLHVPVPQPALAAPSKRRFTAFWLLLSYFAVVGVWNYSVRAREAKRVREQQASLELEAAQEAAEAPSPENLPPVMASPLGEVLILGNIGEWAPYNYNGPRDLPVVRSESGATPRVQPVPQRKMYYARYSKPGNDFAVAAYVTVYPNEAWARHEANVPPVARQVRGIQQLQRFGNNLYQDGPSFFWSSGDKVVRLDCVGVVPEVVNLFLSAYLKKFPSSIQ